MVSAPQGYPFRLHTKFVVLFLPRIFIVTNSSDFNVVLSTTALQNTSKPRNPGSVSP